MPFIPAEEFFVRVDAEQKEQAYQQKLAAAQCDPRDINDPAHPDGDAYYEAMGAELENYPLGALRVSRGTSAE